MAFKVVILCAFALLVQSISGQSCGCSCGSGRSGGYSSSGSIGSVSYSSSISGNSISISSSGGDLPITSVGPISPSGIAVSSDLGLSGTLDVNGQLPFLSAVEFSGKYDTSGSACVDYSCGSCGNVAITSVQGGSGSGCGCGCGRPQPQPEPEPPCTLVMATFPQLPQLPRSEETAMPEGEMGPTLVMRRSPPLLEMEMELPLLELLELLELPYEQPHFWPEMSVMSQRCCGSSSSYGSSIGYGSSSGSSCGSYGGQGCGQVGAAGTIDACGTTCVTGAVPVLGDVCFGGCAPACGSVSICGQCGCGCN
ncbi:uncharacterized protein LOC134802662 [Cydia splendana]|uniref:uncharacterized protein LOC134802662 n=1 Tax=Cydia splendana TaxID=1100963 RepID=UPI00300CB813